MSAPFQTATIIDQGDCISIAITTELERADGIIRSYASVDLSDEQLDELVKLVAKRKGAAVILTEESHGLFEEFAQDAGNWSGAPPVSTGNIDIGPSRRGNFTDLKKKGLITTFEHDGDEWVEFTDGGKAYATEHGITITD